MSDFNILKEKKNPLFNRIEVEIQAKSEQTPSKKEIFEYLSQKYSCPENTIHIEKIRGRFGSDEFKIIARIYSSEKEKNSTEIISKKQKEIADSQKQESPQQEVAGENR